MTTVFPGTTIEISALTKNCSRTLFDGIFATGGITLSQVSIMTGLEPYIIQNWVKRKFVSSPQKRFYSREQFSRIIIINMLRESLQIEKICGLIRFIGGESEESFDDLIGDEELYHRYVDMIAGGEINIINEASVREATEAAVSDFEERFPNSKKQLAKILQIMIYAHAASRLRDMAGKELQILG